MSYEFDNETSFSSYFESIQFLLFFSSDVSFVFSFKFNIAIKVRYGNHHYAFQILIIYSATCTCFFYYSVISV
jgi:hypothetical protein